MTHTEALRLALDTLESLQGGCTYSNDGTVEALTVWCPEVIDACRAALAAPSVPSGEPDWRHPTIQALIGGKARREIELQLVDQLLDDPDCDLTSMDMEYWHGLHDKLRERLTTPQPAPAGWRLVPAEPTEAMQAVIRNECDIYGSEWALYAAMLDAAPAAPKE
jgi:hypothetical protein